MPDVINAALSSAMARAEAAEAALAAASPNVAPAQGVNDEVVEALRRIVTEAKLDGLEKRAGWDTWIALADEVLARAALASCATGGGLSKGWVAVPEEPSIEMLEAGWVAYRDSDKPAPFNQLADGFRAMLKAVPPPPSGAETPAGDGGAS